MFGIECEFTTMVASELIERGSELQALLLPGHPGLEKPMRVDQVGTALPMVGDTSRGTKVPYSTYRVGNLTSQALSTFIDRFDLDGIVIACFPRLIPRTVYKRPGMIALNIHPSLLPAHRGPDPLFWILRDGGAGFGVTVHELSHQYDAGRIVAQRSMPFPDGAREHELDSILATAGAELTMNALSDYQRGRLMSQRQDASAASYESAPFDSDYVIDTNRRAIDAWNFIRGVAGRSVPIRVNTPTRTIQVIDAVELGAPGAIPIESDSNDIVIPFKNGWIRALRHPDDLG